MLNGKKILKAIISTVIALSMSVPICVGATSKNVNEEKIDVVLQTKLDGLGNDDIIPVSLWFEEIDYDKVNNEVIDIVDNEVSDAVLSILEANGDDRTLLDLQSREVKKTIEEQKQDSLDMQKAIEAERDISSRKQLLENESNYDKLFSEDKPEIIYTCKYAPNIDLYLSKAQIYEVANSSEVTKLYYADPTINLTTDEEVQTSDSNEIAEYPTYFNVTGISSSKSVFGLYGAGVNVGIYDGDFSRTDDVTYFARSNIKGSKISDDAYVEKNHYSHGSMVACVIGGTKKDSAGKIIYEGAAPYANLYLTAGKNSDYTYKKCIEYLISQGCNVINASVGVSYKDDKYNIYNDITAWIDHVSTAHKVTLVIASGNVGVKGIDAFSMSSNTITVGNCDIDGVVSASSSYSSAIDLPYKPDIVAPGVNIHTPAGTSSGTSFSAPMVTGAVAQFCQLSAVLRNNPNLIKALLISSSKRTSVMRENAIESKPLTISTAIDRKYGSGILNTMNMYVSFHDYNYYQTGQIDKYDKTVNLTQHLSVKNSKMVRIAIVWDRIGVIASDNHSENNGITVKNDNIAVRITAPDGTYYDSVSNGDTKVLFSFPATNVSGDYKIEMTRLSYSGSNINYAVSCSVQKEY